MIEIDKIRNKVENLPTLVGKLRFVQSSFPTDDESLKRTARKAAVEAYKIERSLFADLAESEVPEVTDLSGIEFYSILAMQILGTSTLHDEIIKIYASHPLVSDALSGKFLYERFNKDRKKWSSTKGLYAKLVGNEKPEECPEPKVDGKTKMIFGSLKMLDSMAKKGPSWFTKEQRKHPIAFLDHLLYQYRERKWRREYDKK